MRCRSVDFVLLQVAASYSPAVAIPMVALGTQSETMGIIDFSATAVAASFSVHGSTLGGPTLAWTGWPPLGHVSFVFTSASLILK